MFIQATDTNPHTSILNGCLPPSVRAHSKRVAQYALMTTECLRQCVHFKSELSDEFLDSIKEAAYLFDIGMSELPENLVGKDLLTDEEDLLYKKHTIKGGTLILTTEDCGKSGIFKKIAFEIALFHHENYDGTGFPLGLKGKTIPLAARIVSFSRAFDILQTRVQDRHTMSYHHIIKKLDSFSGTYFDPVIINSFIKYAEVYKQKTQELQQVASSTPKKRLTFNTII